MSELLESVKRLAGRMPIIKTCKPQPIGRRQDGPQFARPQDYDEHDMVALAKHLARLERVEEAAKRLSWAERLEGEAKGAQLPRDRIIDAECDTMMALNELRAALSENADVE